MNQMPSNPKIYHITHWHNLTDILANKGLYSDAKCQDLELDSELVGMSQIKKRRLYRIEVECNPDTKVGEYVPFNFCFRSVMLYILHKGNHPDLNYRGGQRLLVHLQADLREVIRWCDEKGVLWAFSDRNAGTFYTRFYNRKVNLHRVNWNAVNETDFSDQRIKEHKQAEFLVKDFFPWQLVENVGVINNAMQQRVEAILSEAGQTTPVRVEPSWYF